MTSLVSLTGNYAYSNRSDFSTLNCILGVLIIAINLCPAVAIIVNDDQLCVPNVLAIAPLSVNNCGVLVLPLHIRPNQGQIMAEMLIMWLLI